MGVPPMPNGLPAHATGRGQRFALWGTLTLIGALQVCANNFFAMDTGLRDDPPRTPAEQARMIK